jgi:hypothetical protein
VLLDASGRKVLDLTPGPNDASRLAPGAYFVRPASGVMREALSATRVVVVKQENGRAPGGTQDLPRNVHRTSHRSVHHFPRRVLDRKGKGIGNAIANEASDRTVGQSRHWTAHGSGHFG